LYSPGRAAPPRKAGAFRRAPGKEAKAAVGRSAGDIEKTSDAEGGKGPRGRRAAPGREEMSTRKLTMEILVIVLLGVIGIIGIQAGG
jgi:hypothetical protein